MGQALDREQLAALVHMTAAGGTFSTYVRALISNDLVRSGRGKRLVASDIFREGSR